MRVHLLEEARALIRTGQSRAFFVSELCKATLSMLNAVCPVRTRQMGDGVLKMAAFSFWEVI